MQAIQTKYFGPSNVRGSRVKATTAAGSVTVHWDHALNAEGNHRAAAQALADKFGWSGEWVAGDLPDHTTVYVNVRDFGAGFRTGEFA